MNDIIFSQSFRFMEYTVNRYRHNDIRTGAPCHYIAYMREGTARLVGEEVTLEIAPGDFFYIPYGYPYQSYWYGADIARFDSYGFQVFPRAGQQEYPMQKIEPPEEAHELLEALAADKRVSCMSIGRFYQLLGLLLPVMTVGAGSRKSMIVQRAESYMHDHTDYVAADVARFCGVSESALYTAFREVRGYTPTQARHRILTEEAVSLLTTTDLPVEEISRKLGFCSSNYFRKVISGQTGSTPRAIRKNGMI